MAATVWSGHRQSRNVCNAAAAAAAVQGAAARAAAAAAAHRAAVLSLPLWQHSLQCAVTVAAGAAITLLLSRALHREADRVQAGEVRVGVLQQLDNLLWGLSSPCKGLVTVKIIIKNLILCRDIDTATKADLHQRIMKRVWASYHSMMVGASVLWDIYQAVRQTARIAAGAVMGGKL